MARWDNVGETSLGHTLTLTQWGTHDAHVSSLSLNSTTTYFNFLNLDGSLQLYAWSLFWVLSYKFRCLLSNFMRCLHFLKLSKYLFSTICVFELFIGYWFTLQPHFSCFFYFGDSFSLNWIFIGYCLRLQPPFSFSCLFNFGNIFSLNWIFFQAK